MSIVLFDTAERKNFYPLTFTRAIADLRIGIVTLREWWQMLLGEEVFVHTAEYLSELYPAIPEVEHLWIDASVIPTKEMVELLQLLNENDAIADEKGLIAYKRSSNIKAPREVNNVKRLETAWQIIQLNNEILRDQFELFKSTKASVELPESNRIINAEDIIIEEGATIEHAILNASTGPIYIGKNVTIMDGAMIRGPFAAGEGSVIKMGARIYGATTAGPGCVLGGEIKNSVLLGYSNKGHDGYLGDAIIGEWCNLGAGTTNSNLKNNAGEICVWDFNRTTTLNLGKKAGMVMGDYTRTAINSSINTGSTFGICCNIFEGDLLPKMVGNFSWGVNTETKYDIEKATRDINNWMSLKNRALSPEQTQVLRYIFDNLSK